MSNLPKAVTVSHLLSCVEGLDQYWYLAGPYSGNEQWNYIEHERMLQFLLHHRTWAYSPIVHCHAMAHRFEMPTDAKFWQSYNETMIRRAYGVLVYRLPRWELSKGTKAEIDYANAMGIPVEFIDSIPDQRN